MHCLSIFCSVNHLIYFAILYDSIFIISVIITISKQLLLTKTQYHNNNVAIIHSAKILLNFPTYNKILPIFPIVSVTVISNNNNNCHTQWWSISITCCTMALTIFVAYYDLWFVIMLQLCLGSLFDLFQKGNCLNIKGILSILLLLLSSQLRLYSCGRLRTKLKKVELQNIKYCLKPTT